MRPVLEPITEFQNPIIAEREVRYDLARPKPGYRFQRFGEHAQYIYFLSPAPRCGVAMKITPFTRARRALDSGWAESQPKSAASV